MTYHASVGNVVCDSNVSQYPYVIVTFTNDADNSIVVKTSDDFQTSIPAHSQVTERVMTHGQTITAVFYDHDNAVDGAKYTIPSKPNDFCGFAATTTTTGDTTTSSIVVVPGTAAPVVTTTVPCGEGTQRAEDGSCVQNGFWDSLPSTTNPTPATPVVTHPVKQSVPTTLPTTGSVAGPMLGLGVSACIVGAVAVKIGQRAWRHS